MVLHGLDLGMFSLFSPTHPLNSSERGIQHIGIIFTSKRNLLSLATEPVVTGAKQVGACGSVRKVVYQLQTCGVPSSSIPMTSSFATVLSLQTTLGNSVECSTLFFGPRDKVGRKPLLFAMIRNTPRTSQRVYGSLAKTLASVNCAIDSSERSSNDGWEESTSST